MTSSTKKSLVKSRYRTAIIGAGPAGLAAAAGFLRAGMNDFILIEREAETGGILNQCIHNGFGLRFFHDDLSGPEFARRLESELAAYLSEKPGRPDILCSSMLSTLTKSDNGIFNLRVHSKELGLLNIETDSVISATGCRERTRENIEVPGTRPAGIFTAGQAQNLINRRHYSIGRRVVIQGSGDIGLIMARRLTIEGIEVAAVFERLPYLSGSIRNKVQCLDHFGIPLKLGRQITCINGRQRVSSVETADIDDYFHPIYGTETNYNCDTVLFAAGLIPELEAVKPAGVELPDGFHPYANSYLETNIPGLFSAGNCLHINDLADSAAEEGLNAVGSALEFLSNPESFRRQAEAGNKQPPYTEAEPNQNLNEGFFRRLENENLKVCIVCPKGCLLTEGSYGCSRGENYFKQTFGLLQTASHAEGFRQRVSTTIEILQPGKPSTIVPVVSKEEIPVKLIPQIVKRLKLQSQSLSFDSDSVIVETGDKAFVFNLCRFPER